MPKIVYLDAFPAANAHDILAERPDLEVVKILSTVPHEEAFEGLKDAHVYQHIQVREPLSTSSRSVNS